MGRDEDVELAGVVADTGGKARAGQHLIEGVADVLQVAVELVPVALEEVLQDFEEVARERRRYRSLDRRLVASVADSA